MNDPICLFFIFSLKNRVPILIQLSENKEPITNNWVGRSYTHCPDLHMGKTKVGANSTESSSRVRKSSRPNWSVKVRRIRCWAASWDEPCLLAKVANEGVACRMFVGVIFGVELGTDDGELVVDDDLMGRNGRCPIITKSSRHVF